MTDSNMQAAIASALKSNLSIKISETYDPSFNVNKHSPDVVCFLKAQGVEPSSLHNPTPGLNSKGEVVDGIMNYTGRADGKPVNVQIAEFGNNNDPENEAWKTRYNTSERALDTAVSVADPNVPPYTSGQTEIQPRTQIDRKGVYTEYKDIEPGKDNSFYIVDDARSGTTQFEQSTVEGSVLQVPENTLPNKLREMREKAQSCGLM